MSCESPGITRGPPVVWGVDFGSNWIGSHCGGVLAFLANITPCGGGHFSFFRLAFLPIGEGNPPVDLLADSGNGISSKMEVM